jgi:hypothetical protein
MLNTCYIFLKCPLVKSVWEVTLGTGWAVYWGHLKSSICYCAYFCKPAWLFHDTMTHFAGQVSQRTHIRKCWSGHEIIWSWDIYLLNIWAILGREWYLSASVLSVRFQEESLCVCVCVCVCVCMILGAHQALSSAPLSSLHWCPSIEHEIHVSLERNHLC